MTALSLQSSDSTTTSFQLPPPTFRLPVTRSTDVGKKLAPLEVNQVAGHPLTAQGLQCLENIEEGLCAPITPIPIESLKQEPAIDVYVAHDPDNPTFRWIDYYNPIVKKYRCPWMGCKSVSLHFTVDHTHTHTSAGRCAPKEALWPSTSVLQLTWI